MASERRTKIESRKCPSCGGNLEIRENLGHGIIKCPFCKSGVNMFIEEPIEEEREYNPRGKLKREKIKYSKGGSFSKKIAFLPTTGFGKTPQEYDKALMNYSGLKDALREIRNLKDIKDVEKIVRNYEALNNATSGIKRYSIEEINGEKDYGGISSDTNKIINYLRPFTGKTIKEPTEEDLIEAKRLSRSTLEKISMREGQLNRNQRDYESRIETYSKAAAMICLAGGVLFFSYNITGNVVADLSTKTSSFIGAGLLIAGFIASFIWLKIKKKE